MLDYELKKRIDDLCCMLCEDKIEYLVTQEKDKSLKSLFEVKSQFVELIKTFVKEKWTEKLTEENIELADKDFIMSNIHETRADLIYRVKDEDIYFILLEFQSTEDKKMPYRLLSYILEIWRRYEKTDSLPLVIPCVLYTGNTKWKVKTLRSLFKVSDEIKKYIPDFEYVLIDVNSYSDKELIKMANLVSSVVYMAKSKNKEEVADKLKNIINLIAKLDKKEQDAFIRWAEVMFYKEENVVYNYFEENLRREEKEDMALADLVPGAWEIIREEYRTEGRIEGIETGRQEGIIEGREQGIKVGKKEGVKVGILEGRKELLIKILTKKLSIEPNKEILELIKKLGKDKIEAIEDNIFEIASWKDILTIIGQN